MVTAARVTELLEQDMNAEEDLAFELETDSPKRAEIRAMIKATQQSKMLFDTEQCVSNVDERLANGVGGKKVRHGKRLKFQTFIRKSF